MAFAEVRGTEELTKRLLGIGADLPIAQMRAINRTLEGARTRAVTDIVADLGGSITPTAVRRSVHIKKATPRDLVGDLLIGPYLRDSGGMPNKQGRIPLGQFFPTQLMRGVSYRVGKRYLAGAFLATLRSGHRGVFMRRGVARLPIDERFGPSPFKVFRSQLLERHVQAAREQYHARLVHEIGFILSRRAGTEAA